MQSLNKFKTTLIELEKERFDNSYHRDSIIKTISDIISGQHYSIPNNRINSNKFKLQTILKNWDFRPINKNFIELTFQARKHVSVEDIENRLNNILFNVDIPDLILSFHHKERIYIHKVNQSFSQRKISKIYEFLRKNLIVKNITLIQNDKNIMIAYKKNWFSNIFKDKTKDNLLSFLNNSYFEEFNISYKNNLFILNELELPDLHRKIEEKDKALLIQNF